MLQYSRFTLVGINLGFCEEDINLYTNVVFDQISSWVKGIAKPFRERSICDTDKGLSKYEVTTHNWYRPRKCKTHFRLLIVMMSLQDMQITIVIFSHGKRIAFVEMDTSRRGLSKYTNWRQMEASIMKTILTLWSYLTNWRSPCVSEHSSRTIMCSLQSYALDLWPGWMKTASLSGGNKQAVHWNKLLLCHFKFSRIL